MQIPPGSAIPSKSRGNVDAIAKNIIVIEDDVADVNSDPEIDPCIGRHVGVPIRHAALDFDRAARRVDCAGEFDQHAVAGGFDDAPAMRRDGRIDEIPSGSLQPGQGSFLIDAHKAAVAGDIRRQYRRQPSFHPLAGQRRPPDW